VVVRSATFKAGAIKFAFGFATVTVISLFLYRLADAKADSPRLAASYQAVKLQFGPVSPPPAGFMVCEPALVFVPEREGIEVAGWNGWLVEPGV
jgi:hypothetical protein